MPARARIVLAATLLAGCSSPSVLAPPPASHPAKASAPAISEAQAARGVVAVATSFEPTTIDLCSGALVAENLVLTARHCVSPLSVASPACDARGRSHDGDQFKDDASPTQVRVYAREKVDPNVDAPLARASRILHPEGRVLCDADVAFVVLDRRIRGAEVLPMRLEHGIAKGAVVVPIGFGGGEEALLGLRAVRAPAPVRAVGPFVDLDSGDVLGPREFRVETGTCRGDSGGPAIDVRSGEIVGVVSRSASCAPRDNHVFTRIDAFAPLAAAALRAAESQSD